MQTTSFLRLSSADQEELRRRAVRAVLAGESVTQTARLLGVSRQALHKWVRLYRGGGEPALVAGKKGAPVTGGKLKPWQCAQVVRAISGSCPEQFELSGFWLWTREAVRHYIKTHFAIELSLSSVGRYLRRWGLSPQKPAARASPDSCHRWVKEEYPAIRELARRQGAAIFWGSEGGVSFERHGNGRSSRRLHAEGTPGADDSFRCNMLLAIDNSRRVHFRMFDGQLNAGVSIDFMERLLRQCRRKVVLIVDKPWAGQSEEVEQWLAGQLGRIHLFSLPQYGSAPNPAAVLDSRVQASPPDGA